MGTGMKTLKNGREPVRFDHLPRLRELLHDGGKPGLVYAQVAVKNLMAAEQRTEDPENLTHVRGTDYFLVKGPSGEVPMALTESGLPIPGASPSSGERLFFTDGEAAEQAGFPQPKYVIWLTEAPLRPQPRVEAAAPADLEPPRMKRKYTKRKHQPVIHRRGTNRVRGRYTGSMDTREAPPDGTRTEEPQP